MGRRTETTIPPKVAIHPSLIKWIRDRSSACFIAMTRREAKSLLAFGLLVELSGDLIDFKTGKKTRERLFKLSRRAYQVAYPDGMMVRKFKCRVCGKVTAGRMSRGYPMWYPRKHGACPGAEQEAKTVRVRVIP